MVWKGSVRGLLYCRTRLGNTLLHGECIEEFDLVLKQAGGGGCLQKGASLALLLAHGMAARTYVHAAGAAK